MDNFKKCVVHYEKLQDDDFIKEKLLEEILEPIILTMKETYLDICIISKLTDLIFCVFDLNS